MLMDVSWLNAIVAPYKSPNCYCKYFLIDAFSLFVVGKCRMMFGWWMNIVGISNGVCLFQEQAL